jgi:ketosteroid isomerase-like protein
METKSFDTEKDKEILISFVREMAESMTGAQSTKHWAENALWFDIPAFASRGIKPAREKFDLEFGKLKSCQFDILKIETFISDNMGIVCTVQKISTVDKNGTINEPLLVRQTDCFERKNGQWKLIHEHTSKPAGEGWDGNIVTE